MKGCEEILEKDESREGEKLKNRLEALSMGNEPAAAADERSTTFSGFTRCFGERPDFGIDFRAHLFLHPIDEEHSIEMVGLVLNAASEQPITPQNMRHSVLIMEFCGDRIGTRYVASDIWKRKAALFVKVLIRAANHGQLRVYDRHRHDQLEGWFRAIEFPSEIDLDRTQIDHANLKRMAYLLRCQTNAMGLVHRADHVS